MAASAGAGLRAPYAREGTVYCDAMGEVRGPDGRPVYVVVPRRRQAGFFLVMWGPPRVGSPFAHVTLVRSQWPRVHVTVYYPDPRHRHAVAPRVPRSVPCTDGKPMELIREDGSPRRPVPDYKHQCRAFFNALEAPSETRRAAMLDRKSVV